MLRSGLSPLEVPASCPLSPALTDIATPCVASNVVPLRHPQTRFDSLVHFGSANNTGQLDQLRLFDGSSRLLEECWKSEMS